MLYGKEYGGKPCGRCGAKTASVYDECYFCGQEGCSDCMIQQGDDGYRLVCSSNDCVAKAAA